MRGALVAVFMAMGAFFATSRAAGAATDAPPGQHAVSGAPRAESRDRELVLELSVLHGTKTREKTDARLGNMAELREGKFSKYRYDLLSQTKLVLTKGSKKPLKLPSGALLETWLDSRLADGSARLRATISKPSDKALLPLLEVKARPADSFIVAGEAYLGGILVVVFKVIQ